MNLKSSFNRSKIKYYSLARYAFLDALNVLDLPENSKILVPEYICRDMLAPINLLGLTPVFYPVSKVLEPDASVESWPVAHVVLAINYFGFPQNLYPFYQYCEMTGSVLIEDNAHGFLSRDMDGVLLGARAPIGLLSFRKTLGIPYGAALTIQDPDLSSHLQSQLDWTDNRGSMSFRVRVLLAKLPYIGEYLVRLSVIIVRYVRLIRFGERIRLSGEDDEWIIAYSDPRPVLALKNALSNLDEDNEVERRRQLYAKIEELLADVGVASVFPVLAENIAPYGYPFYFDLSQKQKKIIFKRLKKIGLEAHQWPSLPESILEGCPEHYNNIWWINFWKI